MKTAISQSLLGTEDAAPVTLVNPRGASSFLLIGDHAGKAVPAALGSLGLSDAELSRHIGWDIGIAELGQMLADRLDAVFLRQTYSRLVIDCNRSAEQPDAIAAELARRDALGITTTLVALHSFTPSMRGIDRPWQIGILHDGGDTGFAHALLDVLREEADLTVGDNEPYRMDQIDYTIPRHAYPSRPYAEIEIRQDLLGSTEGCAAWADRLARLLPVAATRTQGA
jgi:predicted N-formylglutamate amidohydrolase